MNLYFEEENKKFSVKKIIKEVIIWVIEIAMVILLGYLTVNYTVERTTMIGESMNPALQDGDKILINKVSYQFTEPNRFDVIVFKQSGSEHSYYNIKRVIGLPGETVQIANGKLYIDGEQLNEPLLTDTINIYGLAAEEIQLDENEYFVLGDNRNSSEDSRFANVGNILADDIIGKAWIRMNNFNFIDKLNQN
ncbi:MAG: signal peptidase [Anaerocolumna sp.]|jgi:signal peptidase I|nr:signal peptidase [Anaerocolumna sp.]